jgi:hypothetical protein
MFGIKMKYSKTLTGDLELHICDNEDRFVEVAQKIQVVTNGLFGEKADGLDQSYWDIVINGSLYTIHRDHYLGVSIFSGATDAKKIFEKIERELNL